MIPFVTIVALGEVCCVAIHWMTNSPKPSLQRVVNKNVQLALLNTSSASSDYSFLFLSLCNADEVEKSVDIV